MAAVEKLKAEKGDAAVDEATCALGLSLGEYTALCFAGASSFEDGVKVTKARCVICVSRVCVCSWLASPAKSGWPTRRRQPLTGEKRITCFEVSAPFERGSPEEIPK